MAYFPNFSRFSSFSSRPRRHTEPTLFQNQHQLQQQQQQQQQEQDEQDAFIPFIPPGAEPEGDKPVIPNTLLKIKAYRWRPSREGWKHAETSGMGMGSGYERERPGYQHYDVDLDRMPEDNMHMRGERAKPPCSNLRIITWNIDMVSPQHEARLTAALRHIAKDVLKCASIDTPPPDSVILFQEVSIHVMPHLLKDPWVRRWFAVTPYTADKWPEGAHYGCVTLVGKGLDIAESHILHFGLSSQHRTGVCVKLRLCHPGTQEKVVLGVVNTHLESLPEGAQARPAQLDLCARFLRLRGVGGGVVAGDMNAISEEDRDLHKDVGLRDAWRRREDDDDEGKGKGKTWGFQGQNDEGFPIARLDKVFYVPGMGYKVDEPKRIGLGVRISEKEGGLFVSDHCGLETTLHMLKPRSNSA